MTEVEALRAENARLRAERDAARAWARRWKRGAKHIRIDGFVRYPRNALEAVLVHGDPLALTPRRPPTDDA